MDSWTSIYNAQMANNIVKWWKTKFLNGYKQFSVECGEGKVSDTEELLGRLGSEEDANERLRAACTTPPLQPQAASPQRISPSSENSSPKKQQQPLNFEEFSCDVSVENGNNKSGQEFSFTLYDFDGHGKITKDDIAGLVTTIYEALGSSVKVPHYGSKTIKVKLTVSPDQSATLLNQKDAKLETSIRYKKDLNVTIRQGNNKTRRCKRHSKSRKHHCCENDRHEEDQDNQSEEDSSDACSRVSGTSDDDEDEGECSDNEHSTANNKTKKHHRKDNGPRYTIPNLFMKDLNDNCAKANSVKKRSGSLQRQELLEIIQANMDKNNISFQTSRKHSNNPGPDSNNKQLTSDFKRPKTKVSTSTLQYLANIVDPTRFYVDLAALQNTTHLPQSHYQYDKLIDAVMCVSNKRIALSKQKCKKHNRVKTEQYELDHPPIINDVNKNKPKRVDKNINNSDVKNMGKVANGHTSSPHHLRHRNRQEDQARAMAQVVRWLEQEFSTKEKEKTKTETSKEKNNQTPSNNSAGVERHEHHHVHEHIHHHYHHYQEGTPLVV